MNATCARCKQPCVVADDVSLRRFMYGVVGRYLDGKQIAALPEREPMCSACYVAYQAYRANEVREPIRQETAKDAVERYESWCDKYTRDPDGTQRPTEAQAFFTEQTLREYSNRINNAVRRVKTGNRGASL